MEDLIELKKLRTIAYVRVSRLVQSYDSQYQCLKEYCKRNGYDDVEFHQETASGSKQKRPVLDNILKLVRSGSVKRILTYRLDRLGRSLQDLLAHISVFNEYGTDFISVSDGINTSTDSPFGRLQLQLLGVVSEYEKSLIRERCLAGLAAARAKGRVGGRPGLSQETKDRINHKLKEGFHPRTISRELGISPASVYKAKKQLVLAA